MKRGGWRRILSPVVALVVLLGACADNPAPTPQTPTPSPSDSARPTPAATASPTPGGADPEPAPSTSPVVCGPNEGGGDTGLQLVDIRVGTHDGFDRFVLEFSDPEPPAGAILPRYMIKEVESLVADPSGMPVTVAGGALYQLVVFGASGVDLSSDTPVVTYNGPNEFTPDFEALVEVEGTGDFEAVLSYGIGLRSPGCFKVFKLDDPLRLVVDIPHS